MRAPRTGRVIVVAAAAGLALAACNKKDEGTSSATATPTPSATSTAVAAGFTPPTSISRADYGGKIERRFRKLDKNGDNKLERDELPPKRADKLLRKGDKNGDGALDASEWSAIMLAKFDKRDANHDGNLTSDEKGGKHRGGGRRNRGADAGFADDSDDVDNGF